VVLDLALLEGLEAPLVVRSFAACLASAAEVPLQQVPLPDAALSEALGHPGDGRSVARLLLLPDGGRLGYAEARRNIITRGIDLNALVGRRFRIDNVECVGQRLCEPCAHLERLTTKGVLRGLIHRGGLRADILSDGLITTSASIRTID
jgi:hypothetical protein